MFNKKLILSSCQLLLFITLFQIRVTWGQSKVGTTAVPFLGISVGARATAMGGAFTARCDDATSLYYNPGGFSQMKKSQFMVAHTNWLLSTNFNWVGFIYNLDGTNSIGLSVTQLDYGEEEVTTVNHPEGTGEKWSAMDFTAAISYSRNLTNRFSIGGSVKYIQQKIWNEGASAFALDIGLLFVTQFNNMKLGMSICNFGTDLRMDGKDLLKRVDLDPEAVGHNETIVSKLKTDNWPLPLFFRVGIGMDLFQIAGNRLAVALDAVRPSDNTETVNLGGEYSYHNMFFLRGGYKSLFRKDNEEGLTLGVGVNVNLGNQLTWIIDYTYANFGLLEDIWMIATGVNF